MEQTAVIGLGAMGLPIAQRLAESLPVTVFDPDAGRTSAAAQAGARVAATAADAVAGCGVVLIVVRTLPRRAPRCSARTAPPRSCAPPPLWC